MKKEDIEGIVINVLKAYLPPVDTIKLHHRIIDDLKISSDDTMFIPIELEQATGIKVPNIAWKKVYTVDQIVSVLEKYDRLCSTGDIRDSSDIEKVIYDMLVEQVGEPTKENKYDDDIVTIFGISGDDAQEFIWGFQKRFNVDMSNFSFSQYFDIEGFSIVEAIKSVIGLKSQREKLTLRKLAEIAQSKIWPARK